MYAQPRSHGQSSISAERVHLQGLNITPTVATQDDESVRKSNIYIVASNSDHAWAVHDELVGFGLRADFPIRITTRHRLAVLNLTTYKVI